MGLGKTVQTLALICHARERWDVGPFLVVAPASVISNWAAEARRFAPDLDVRAVTRTETRRGMPLDEAVAGADIVVTSYALFRLEYDEYEALTWAGLILDEAQFVKNPSSQGVRVRDEAAGALQARDHRNADGEQPRRAVVAVHDHHARHLRPAGPLHRVLPQPDRARTRPVASGPVAPTDPAVPAAPA